MDCKIGLDVFMIMVYIQGVGASRAQKKPARSNPRGFLRLPLAERG